MEQHTRVELASSVWKTDVLPLHQCCGMLPVLHGCGSVLDRNPEPGFPTRSAKVSKTFGERLRLHGRTLFLRKKRYTMLLCAMPKRTAWGWDSELNRSNGVIKPQSAPASIVGRASARTLAYCRVLRKDSGLQEILSTYSVLHFFYAIAGFWGSGRSAAKKLSPRASRRLIFLCV